MTAGALVLLLAGCGDGMTPEQRAEKERMSQLSMQYDAYLQRLEPRKVVVTYDSSVSALDPKERGEMNELIRLAGSRGIAVDRGRRNELFETLSLGKPPVDYLAWRPSEDDIAELAGKIVLVVNFDLAHKPVTVRHSKAKEADIDVRFWNPVYDREQARRNAQ